MKNFLELLTNCRNSKNCQECMTTKNLLAFFASATNTVPFTLDCKWEPIRWTKITEEHHRQILPARNNNDKMWRDPYLQNIHTAKVRCNIETLGLWSHMPCKYREQLFSHAVSTTKNQWKNILSVTVNHLHCDSWRSF